MLSSGSNRGPDHTLRWWQEILQLRHAMDGLSRSGRILELACGTALWTEQLARYDQTLTAIDTSSEVLALNRVRVRCGTVHDQQCDIFQWESAELYDFIFFGFWLSHVPSLGSTHSGRSCAPPLPRVGVCRRLFRCGPSPGD